MNNGQQRSEIWVKLKTDLPIDLGVRRETLYRDLGEQLRELWA